MSIEQFFNGTGTPTLALGVADPTAGAGVAADLHTEGYTNETPPRYFKKVGAGDTDWGQLSESINPKWYGALGDGTTDDTTAMQNALDAAVAAGKPLMIPAGTYRLASLVSSSSSDPVEIIGYGGRVIINAESTFSLSSSAEDLLTLSSNVNRGDLTVSLTDASSVSVGQVLRFSSSIIVEPERNRTHRFTSVVTAKSGNDVTLARPVTLNFHTGDTGLSVSVRTLRKVSIRNLSFSQTGVNRCFDCRTAQGVIENCEFYASSKSSGTVGMLDNCVQLIGYNNYFHDALYGLLIQTCSQVRFSDTRADRTRHPFLPTFWSDGLYFNGLQGEGNTGLMDSHESFDVNYNDVYTQSDTAASNIRSAGGSLRNSRLVSLDNTSLVLQSIAFASSPHDYSDLYVTEIDFDVDNVEVVSNQGLSLSYGRNVTLNRVRVYRDDRVTPASISISAGIPGSVKNLDMYNCFYASEDSVFRGSGLFQHQAPHQLAYADTTGGEYDGALAGTVTSFTNAGTGYSDANDVILTGGTGSNATCDIVTSAGAITSLTFNDHGVGYSSGDVLTVSGGGADAQITLTSSQVVEGTYRIKAGLNVQEGRMSRFRALINSEFNGGVAGEVLFALQVNPASNPLSIGGTSGYNFAELSFFTVIRHANSGGLETKRTTYNGVFISANALWDTPSFVSDDTGQASTTMELDFVDRVDPVGTSAKEKYYTLFFLLKSGRTNPIYGALLDATFLHMPV